MGNERTHSFQKKSSHTPQPTTQFASRPFDAPVQMKAQEQQTPDELENEAFNQNKFEAFGLQLKEKSGTITPVEQEQLSLLQAKMDDFWAQRQERASRFSYDFSKVSVTPPGEPAAPQIQPMSRQGTSGVPMEGQRELLNSPQQLPQHTPTETPFASAGERAIQAKSVMAGNCQVTLQEQRPNQTGLPDNLKTGIENLSGYSMDDVRVNYKSDKPAQLQAHAYAQGTDIYVASNQEKHLPHEAWHVVQQKQGRVKPTIQMKNRIAVNDDESLEHEADVMGAKALVNAIQFQGTPQKQEGLQDAFTPINSMGKEQGELHLQRENVVQLIGGYGLHENHYKEVNIKDDTDTAVEGLNRGKKTLAVTDMDDMDMENDDVRSTTETGYQVLQLGQGENQSDWQITPTVLRWNSPKRLHTFNNFNLPVSCIESAEHVIHHLHKGGNIPDYDPKNPGKKQVGLHFNHRKTKTNQQALNISDEPLEDLKFKQWKDFNFNAAAVKVGEGLLVANPANSGETMHAVVVVGKNTATGQLIVLERNAGTTTGDNMYVDNSWLVNVYDNPAAFRDSVGKNFIVGKLAAI